MSDRLYTVAEAAEYLEVSQPTVYYYRSKAGLRSVKKGKRIFFQESELKRYKRMQTASEMKIEMIQGFAKKDPGISALMQFGEMVTMFDQIAANFSEETREAYLNFISKYSAELGQMVADSYKRENLNEN